MNEERPIEKLLRRYAQQRRDEADPPSELHPATRRLLQGEVARQFPVARPGRAGGFWGMLRARWIYAVTCLVVISGSAALLWPVLFPSPTGTSLTAQEDEMTLAKAATPLAETRKLEALPQLASDKKEVSTLAVSAPTPVAAEPTPVARPAAPPPASLAAPTTTTAVEAEVQRRAFNERYALAPTTSTSRTEADRAWRTSPPATVPPPASVGRSVPASSSPEGRTGETAQKSVSAAAPPTASSGPAPQARTRTDYSRLAGAPTQDLAVRSQSFANIARQTAAQKAKQSAATSVLNNFRVEQTGDQVRVIDGDGSTYMGTIAGGAGAVDTVTEARPDARAISQRSAQPARGIALQQPTANYLYTVTGTNLTLQKPVSFIWNFVPPSNAPGVAGLQLRDNFQNQQLLPWTNANINGQVRVNAGTQFELNAVPVPR